jgi:hypothetical protein
MPAQPQRFHAALCVSGLTDSPPACRAGIERTHAWHERWRRMVMQYGRKASTPSARAWLAEVHTLLSRLALVG